MAKIVKGVMVVKDGKGWGVTCKYGDFLDHGWVDLDYADIHEPEFCNDITDLTYEGGPYIDEIKRGKLVHVTKTTTVLVGDDVS